MNDFTGKNVLVFGGSRGIGAAIVRRFAKAGGNVAFTYAGSKDAAETTSPFDSRAPAGWQHSPHRTLVLL